MTLPTWTILSSGRAAWCVAVGVCLCLSCGGLRAGWIEDAPGKTVIHVTLWSLPDPSRTDTYTRSEAAAVK